MENVPVAEPVASQLSVKAEDGHAAIGIEAGVGVVFEVLVAGYRRGRVPETDLGGQGGERAEQDVGRR